MFIDMFYFCPQYAYTRFISDYTSAKTSDGKTIKFDKHSKFSSKEFFFKMHSKILTYIFFKHKKTGSLDYNEIVSIVLEMLKKENELEPKTAKFNNSVLKDIKPILEMFNQEDSFLIKYTTIKDKFVLNEEIKKYLSFENRSIKQGIFLDEENEYVYDVEIPFIITKRNSTRTYSLVMFTDKSIEKCSMTNDINSMINMLYVKNNSFYKNVDKVIFYDFKSMKRTECEYDFENVSKIRDLIKIIFQLEFKLFVKNISDEKCTDCGNVEFCKNYNYHYTLPKKGELK